MTEGQIRTMIESNKCLIIEVRNLSGEKLCHINSSSTGEAIDQLDDCIKNFKNDYRKVNVYAKDKELTNWSKGFCWTLDFPKATEEKKDGVATIGNSNQGLNVMDYITMMNKNTESQLQLHKEIMELKLKQDKNDPSQWIGVINAVAPIMGFKTAPNAGMAGPQLQFADTKEKSPEEIVKEMELRLANLAKKIKGSQMLRLLIALDSNPELSQRIDNINTIMEGVAKNPAIVDQAIQFIK